MKPYLYLLSRRRLVAMLAERDATIRELRGRIACMWMPNGNVRNW